MATRRPRYDVAQVRRAVAAGWPHYRIDTVVALGAGLDNVAYAVNGELIVRFSRSSDPQRVEREARLLATLARISRMPVPEPVFTVAELGCLAYVKLAGTPLLHRPLPDRSEHATSIAAALGGFLGSLHAVAPARLTGLVDTDRAAAGRVARAGRGDLPGRRRPDPYLAYRGSIEGFLDSPPPDDQYVPAFSHNDLGIEHVLVDRLMWTVTGVIDWSDAAIVDPARDFGLLYRDILGPAALDAALGRYPTDPRQLAALRERAVFYARCGVLEDLAYGVDAYVEKSLAATPWLFPPRNEL